MHRVIAAAGVVVASIALTLGTGTAAQASTLPRPSALVLHEHVDFASNVLRFTTDGPICHSGTWVDDVDTADVKQLDAAGTLFLIPIDSVYTCDDGSGTFDAHKVLVVRGFADGSQASTGVIRISGGTGRYSRILAVGTDTGSSNADGIGTGAARLVLERL